MRRMHVKEYLDRNKEIWERYEYELQELKRKRQYEVDMLEINYHGRNWLVTGKVGGWDEE